MIYQPSDKYPQRDIHLTRIVLLAEISQYVHNIYIFYRKLLKYYQ